MGFFANILASFLATSINTFTLPKRLGMAINETAYQREPKNLRRPDVSYFELAKFPSLEVLFQDPPVIDREPNLAIEVVSEDEPDRQRDLVTKREEYARAGIAEYWIVDPQEHQITVLTLEGQTYRVHGEFGRGSVATSVLLPGFSVSVDAVFAAGQSNS